MATTQNSSTIVCAFDSLADAQATVQDLVHAGVPQDDISLIANHEDGSLQQTMPDTDDVKKTVDGTTVGENIAAGTGVGALGGLLIGLGAIAIPGLGLVIAAGPLAAALGGAISGAIGGGLIGALKDAGVPDNDANFYGEHLRRGGAVLAVHTNADQEERIGDVLNRHNAVEVGEREESFRKQGWTGFRDDHARVHTSEPARVMPEVERRADASSVPMSNSAHGEASQSLPVVEEELSVGKRQVARGGVRVYNRVSEQPVEEQIDLREEHVVVDRRPANRPATDADFQLGERGIELTEVAEEPVVSKQTRVVEEVVVGKDVGQRTETVRDTVRRTDVGVEPLGEGSESVVDFRDDFRTRFGHEPGATYENYAPAYQYGYRMAGDTRYQGRLFEESELSLRDEYLRIHPNSTWETVKGAVRGGWNRMTGR